MTEAKKSHDIGMRRGRVLPNLPQPKQLDVIADGLPILMKSAGDLLAASKALGEHHRAATILKGHAMEEIAKILSCCSLTPPTSSPTRTSGLANQWCPTAFLCRKSIMPHFMPISSASMRT